MVKVICSAVDQVLDAENFNPTARSDSSWAFCPTQVYAKRKVRCLVRAVSP